MTHSFFCHFTFKFLLLLFFFRIYFSFPSFGWLSWLLNLNLLWTFVLFLWLLFLLIIVVSEKSCQLFHNIFRSKSFDLSFFVIIIFNIFHNVNMILNPFIFFILGSICFKFCKNSVFFFCFQKSFNIFLKIFFFNKLPSINVFLHSFQSIIDLVFRVFLVLTKFINTQYISFFNGFIRFRFEYCPLFDRRLPLIISFFLSLSLFSCYFFLPLFHFLHLLVSFYFNLF